MTTREIFDRVEDAVYAVAHHGSVPLKAQAEAMGMSDAQLRAAVDPGRSPRLFVRGGTSHVTFTCSAAQRQSAHQLFTKVAVARVSKKRPARKTA